MKKSNVRGTATKILLARRDVFPGLSSWSFDNDRVMRVESGNDTMKPPNTGVLLATHSAVEMINADKPMLRPSSHIVPFLSWETDLSDKGVEAATRATDRLAPSSASRTRLLSDNTAL